MTEKYGKLGSIKGTKLWPCEQMKILLEAANKGLTAKEMLSGSTTVNFGNRRYSRVQLTSKLRSFQSKGLIQAPSIQPNFALPPPFLIPRPETKKTKKKIEFSKKSLLSSSDSEDEIEDEKTRTKFESEEDDDRDYFFTPEKPPPRNIPSSRYSPTFSNNSPSRGSRKDQLFNTPKRASFQILNDELGQFDGLFDNSTYNGLIKLPLRKGENDVSIVKTKEKKVKGFCVEYVMNAIIQDDLDVFPEMFRSDLVVMKNESIALGKRKPVYKKEFLFSDFGLNVDEAEVKTNDGNFLVRYKAHNSFERPSDGEPERKKIKM